MATAGSRQRMSSDCGIWTGRTPLDSTRWLGPIWVNLCDLWAVLGGLGDLGVLVVNIRKRARARARAREERNMLALSSEETMKLIIQIPAWNEEEDLPETLAALPSSIDGVDEIEVLVVDDGSTDRTAEVAREAGAEVLRMPVHRGLAVAFSAGLRNAVERGADVIVNTDADNQYDARDIPALVQPILDGSAQMVIGDRQVASLSHFSSMKRLLQKLGSSVVRRLSGTRCTRRHLRLPSHLPRGSPEAARFHPLHLHPGDDSPGRGGRPQNRLGPRAREFRRDAGRRVSFNPISAMSCGPSPAWRVSWSYTTLYAFS